MASTDSVTTNNNDANSASLLTIPPELRLQIYSYLFNQPGPIPKKLYNVVVPSTPLLPRRLLLIHPLITAEIPPHYYSVALFILPLQASYAFVSHIGRSPHLSRMRNLEIRLIDDVGGKGGLQAVVGTLKAAVDVLLEKGCPRIKKVIVGSEQNPQGWLPLAWKRDNLFEETIYQVMEQLRRLQELYPGVTFKAGTVSLAAGVDLSGTFADVRERKEMGRKRLETKLKDTVEA
ncbi:hypothetical protein K402DRAFT_421450 [Aulographum hederae CBS 113979]|uniref:Uncharacterized protein n=1 Tax=Aulographum hederae CBS 113979 TaxID=1176131 RepID=A0A6G1GZ61_9PEZI|nr:hypothetical protein K402DRAFT_421450 [Aulographum hederae CBS 113979]